MLCFPIVASVDVAEEERGIEQSGLDGNRTLKKCKGCRIRRRHQITEREREREREWWILDR